MNLGELERKYGEYYAPAFKVAIGRQDLVRELFQTVTSVEVDLAEKAMGTFSFTVANAFDLQQRAFVLTQGDEVTDLIELFAFGTAVEISFGYGDPSKLEPLMQGIITSIKTSFSEGGVPELTVSGFDGLYPLNHKEKGRHWENRRDSEVVADLVRGTGLRTDIQDTQPKKPRIDKTQETDLSFLGKLADRNKATFYVRAGDFYFGPRGNAETELITLPWGRGLLSFSPEADLAKQAKTVEVHGRSAETGEEIVGRATVGDESSQKSEGKGGAERVGAALNNEPDIIRRAAVHTQAEADELARSMLEERSQEFLKGSGECIGLPEIVPDINVALTDIGKPFSMTYYISGATHRIDSGGYRVNFKAQEPFG